MATHLGLTRAGWETFWQEHPWPQEYAKERARAERKVSTGLGQAARKRRLRRVARQGKRKHVKKDDWLDKDSGEFASKWTK